MLFPQPWAFWYIAKKAIFSKNGCGTQKQHLNYFDWRYINVIEHVKSWISFTYFPNDFFFLSSPFMIYDFFLVFFLNWNKTIMVEDTLNLIAHSIMEIKFCISFISSTFLIRFTFYEILRVFWKLDFQKYASPMYYGIVVEIYVP